MFNEEYFVVIPEFNSDGRLCNYHSPEYERNGELSDSEENKTAVKVPVEEFERFNMLAGRLHEIIEGIVVFNEELEPCLPDFMM